MYILFVYSGLKGRWLDLPRIQSIVGLMTASFISPILLLSIIPHQEPRFIIPTILPLVFLYAPNINEVSGVDMVVCIRQSSKDQNSLNPKRKLHKLQLIWFLCNILLTIFYGFIHQAGVLPLTSHVAAELKAKPELTHIHLYTSHMYSIPTALLQLRNTKRTYVTSGNHKFRLIKDFHFYEQGSNSIKDVCEMIFIKLQECEENYAAKRIRYRLYYAFPASDLDDFIECSLHNNTNLLRYHIVNKFYPHLSTEKMPLFKFMQDISLLTDMSSISTHSFLALSDSVTTFLQEFQLILVRIEYLFSNNLRHVMT